jgi:hypothetical protein
MTPRDRVMHAALEHVVWRVDRDAGGRIDRR